MKFSGVSGVIVHWFDRFGLLLAISPFSSTLQQYVLLLQN
jgi:hypothetical protein